MKLQKRTPLTGKTFHKEIIDLNSIYLPYKIVKIVDAVESGIRNQVIRVEGNNIYLIRHLFPSENTARELYIKNLFLYTRVKNITKPGEALYVKDMETDDLIAFFKNDKAICLL